jgi:Acetyltransferase (GNAT) family
MRVLGCARTRRAASASVDPAVSAEYPADLEAVLTLPNARRARVRPLQRHEDGVVRALYAHLSCRTRYQRFFSPMPELPDSVLHLLVDVDHRTRLALIVHRDEAPDDIVGMGSFGAVDGCTAEVSLVVRDDWQRQGVGIELAIRILQAAEARGFHSRMIDRLPRQRAS